MSSVPVPTSSADLNVPHRSYFRSSPRVRTGIAQPTWLRAPEPTAISIANQVDRVNRRNRVASLGAEVLAMIFFVCIVATVMTIGGWFVYSVLTEIGSWEFRDLLNQVAGFNAR